jgi:hypothetical protein
VDGHIEPDKSGGAKAQVHVFIHLLNDDGLAQLFTHDYYLHVIIFKKVPRMVLAKVEGVHADIEGFLIDHRIWELLPSHLIILGPPEQYISRVDVTVGVSSHELLT